mmetsp:Transcript_359/g.1164  ORF Transcript_359/g.1164 Transcript_359/m.1164 type:complete len:182 (+) Transcript_359:41-586(+)|eukprot:scaffold109310_cov28-Tisochrysis_lutea.AAC.1
MRRDDPHVGLPKKKRTARSLQIASGPGGSQPLPVIVPRRKERLTLVVQLHIPKSNASLSFSHGSDRIRRHEQWLLSLILLHSIVRVMVESPLEHPTDAAHNGSKTMVDGGGKEDGRLVDNGLVPESLLESEPRDGEHGHAAVGDLGRLNVGLNVGKELHLLRLCGRLDVGALGPVFRELGA